MLAFCLQSLLREYGWQFFWRVAAPHPVKTTKALIRASTIDFSGDRTSLCTDKFGSDFEGDRLIVGLGFCLKPMDPPCPSGRFNHDCDYLENKLDAEAQSIPAACQACAIREIGILTLRTGAAFYIMTSARDILFDLFTPALTAGRFRSGLFLLCRYSLRPFAVGLLASGMRGWLFPFEKGDCRDYRTWLQADRGVKDEQTGINASNLKAIATLLNEARETLSAKGFERRGNILYPRADQK